jgi:hypothetical protein
MRRISHLSARGDLAMFYMASNDVHRFPAGRSHDRRRSNAVGHQILRGSDPPLLAYPSSGIPRLGPT